MVFRLCLLSLVLAAPASAAEIAGVKLEDQAQVGNTRLQLNGAGLRKRLFFQVYAIGLYLPRKATAAHEAIEAPGPKRIAIHMLRNVGAAEFSEALAEGIRANHSAADARALQPRLQELAATMAELKEAKKGMAIVLDSSGPQMQLLIDGRPAGQAIAGEDFYRALLRIWLGPSPVQDDLKQRLLGG